MKPLTIDELKALKVGDWVYIQALTTETSPEFDLQDTEFYYRVAERQDDTFFEVVGGELVARHYLDWDDYGTKWLAYKNKEQAEAEGEILELPFGWIDTLKLLTCAAMCYADIKQLMENKMKDSKDIADLYFDSPQVQGGVNLWSLGNLADSKIDCNKITGFEDVLNAMPAFKDYLERLQEQKK